MESLYRKYRPQTFADVVGQQHVVGTLEHAVLENRTSHAYLFCGPRGTGKTTMARLLAKALMCEQGPGHLPDGTCAQCKLIAAGDHPDVYELDAASRTGVDNVREEIINSVGYAPTQGRCKMYIIDEVHMLTTAAFNALLKTLEEPPDHVIFVLCTTDPQKIPATILSRVQRFDFRPIGNDDIRRHLAYVCEQEGFTYEDAALDLVTAHARGGMRDALSTLEQLSVFSGGVIGLEAAQDLLGAVSGSALVHVMDALARRDVPSLFEQVGSLVNAGRDLLQFVRELAAHVRDVYVVAAVGANPAVLPAGSDVERLRAEATAMGSVDRLSRMLLLLGDVSKEMGTAPNQRLVLEIAFTRMARPEVDLTLESLAERVEELELKLSRMGSAGSSVPAAQNSIDSSSSGLSANTAPQAQASGQQNRQTIVGQPVQQRTQQREAQRDSQPTPRAAVEPEAWSESEHAPQATVHRQSAAPSQPAPRPAAQPAAQSAPQPAPRPAVQPAPQPAPQPQPRPNQQRSQTNPGALQRAWRQVVSDLMTRIPARGTLLSNAVATSDNGAELVVSLPKGSSFALKMLERPDIKAVVEQSVVHAFGPRTLVFKEGTDSSSQTSAPRTQQATQRSRTPQASRFEQTNAPAYATPPSPYAEQQRVSGARSAAPYSQPSRPGQQAGWESGQTGGQAVGQRAGQAPVRPVGQPAGQAPARPAPTTATVPQPDYPLPWDNPTQLNGPTKPTSAQAQAPVPAEPTSAQVQAPVPAEPPASEYDDQYYDVVPYEELGAFSQDYDEPGPSYDLDPIASPQPATQAPRPVSAGRQAAASTSQPPAFGHQQAPGSAPAPNQQQRTPSAEADRFQSPAQSDSHDNTPAPVDVLVGPDELPPELARILEDAFEVFGNGVRASKES